MEVNQSVMTQDSDNDSNNPNEKFFTQNIKCRLHPQYNVEKFCFSEKCKSSNAWVCVECISSQNHPHIKHYQDLIGMKSVQYFYKNIEDSNLIGYKQIKNTLSLNYEQFEQQIDQYIKEIEKKVNKEFKIFKENILKKYGVYFQSEDARKDKLEKVKNMFLPIEKIQQICKEFQSNQTRKQEVTAEKLKDLLWNPDTQEKRAHFQESFVKDVEIQKINQQIHKNLEEIKNDFSEVINKAKDKYMKIDIQQNIIIQGKVEAIKQMDLVGIQSFRASPYNSSIHRINFEDYDSQGLIQFTDHGYYKRAISNDIGLKQVCIFKMKLPKLKQERSSTCFWIGVAESSEAQKQQPNKFGSGNWIKLDDNEQWKEFLVNNEQKDVAGKLQNNSEILVVIYPQNNVFNFISTDGKLLVKNKSKFDNKNQNKFWNFHILDGYNKDVIINNKITDEDLKIVVENLMLDDVTDSLNNSLEMPSSSSHEQRSQQSNSQHSSQNQFQQQQQQHRQKQQNQQFQQQQQRCQQNQQFQQQRQQYQPHMPYHNFQNNNQQMQQQYSQQDRQHGQQNMQHSQQNMQHSQQNMQHNQQNMQHNQQNMQQNQQNMQHNLQNMQHNSFQQNLNQRNQQISNNMNNQQQFNNIAQNRNLQQIPQQQQQQQQTQQQQNMNQEFQQNSDNSK